MRDLPTQIELDRIIDEENTKTYHITMVVADLDQNQEYAFINPVSVLDEAGKLLGAATLNVSGRQLEAELFIGYNTPERFDLQTKSAPIVPELIWKDNVIVGLVLFNKKMERKDD